MTKWFAWFQVAFCSGPRWGDGCIGIVGDIAGLIGMVLAVVCYSLCTLVCYFAPSVEMMLLTRFVACLGIGGVWPNAVVLVSEAWPNTSRPVLAGLLGAAANVGFVLLGSDLATSSRLRTIPGAGCCWSRRCRDSWSCWDPVARVSAREAWRKERNRRSAKCFARRFVANDPGNHPRGDPGRWLGGEC